MAEMNGADRGATDVVLWVCIECGREVQLEEGETPPPDLECEKCGNQVFRRFDAGAAPGEARSEFQESTERELSTDEAATDTESGDVLDLDAR